jgi:hypothetical protein
VFERFTNHARRVVVYAQEEARLLNHDYIGTEHILLGLIRESEGMAGTVLSELGVTLAAVREKAEELAGRGSKEPSGHIPFTVRAKKVLELSLREALTLKNHYIGTEHILLGLIREQDGLGYRLLGEVGADQDRVRQLTLARTSSAREAEGEDTQTHTRLGLSLGSLSAIESRLVRIERRLGIDFPSAISDLSRRLNEVRRDKAAAIESQDFDRAAQLRDLEHRLAADRIAALREMPDPDEVTPIEHELANARTEIERLTGLLRSHGIDPGEPEPGHPPAAAEG